MIAVAFVETRFCFASSSFKNRLLRDAGLSITVFDHMIQVKQGKLLLHYIERAAQCRWSDMVEHLGWGSLTLAPAPLYVQKLSGWEEQVFFEIKEMERTIMKRSWRILDESNEVDVAKRRKLG